MAAIPVPVHFDGHNINIITEDSPSTRKCWSKGGQQRRRIPKIPQCARDEVYIQNLSMPISPSNKENVEKPTPPARSPPAPPQRTTFNPRTPGSSENGTDGFNPSELECETAPATAGDASAEKKSAHNFKLNSQAEAFQPRQQQPPQTINGATANHQATTQPNTAANAQAMPRVTCPPCRPARAAGHAKGAKQQVTNAQLIKMGLDPNEFGSHDDVGFEEERSAKDRQSLYKTELCREWSTSGWCYYNKRCSFAHGLHELRPVFRSRKWRTKRCRNWHTTGYCPYEHRCQFLHDQSPPRRMQDYTGVGNAAVPGMVGAEQQPKQPMYFHYKVDCDRQDQSQKDDDEKDETAKEGEGVSADESTDAAKPSTAQGGASPSKVNSGSRTRFPPPSKPGATRLVMMSKVGKHERDPQFENKKYPEMNMAPRQRAQQQRERAISLQRSKEQYRERVKKKRAAQLKDTVITPFHPTPVVPVQAPAAFNPMAAAMSSMSMSVASQSVAMQPPLASVPGMPLMGGVGVAQHTAPLSSQPSSLFMPPLPPSIDPNLYLNLTPSPGTGPVSTLGGKTGDEAGPEAVQQLELKLSEQQAKLQEMHQKVREAAVRGQLVHDEAQATLGALDGVDTDLEASPGCASIGEDLLHSFLPNDPLIETRQADKLAKDDDHKDSDDSATQDGTGPGSGHNLGEATTTAKGKTGKKRPDPPLCPPPLQLQTSMNSVVNGAVNAAMTPTMKLVPVTPTPAAGSGAESSVSAAAKAAAAAPLVPSAANTTTTHHFHHHYGMPPMPSVYAQQAHAHAHAYAAAHVNHGAYPVPLATTPAMGPVPMAPPYGMPMAPLGSMPMPVHPPMGLLPPTVPTVGGVGYANPAALYNPAASIASMQSPEVWQFESRHY